jgi:hypothetical protein
MKYFITLLSFLLITTILNSQEKLEKVYIPKSIVGGSLGLVYDSRSTGKYNQGIGGLHVELNYKHCLIESNFGLGANLGFTFYLNQWQKNNKIPPVGAEDIGYQNHLGAYLTPLAFLKFGPIYLYSGVNLQYMSKDHVYEYLNRNYKIDIYTPNSKEEFFIHPVGGIGVMFFSQSINKSTQKWGFYISAEGGYANEKFLQHKLSFGTVYIY